MATQKQLQDSAARRADNRAHVESNEPPTPRVRARPVVPGARIKINKRCSERRLFLAPGEDPKLIRDLIGYCYGLALRDRSIKLHAAVVMSNHHHTDITDPLGELIGFKQDLHSHIAKAINALYGRSGPVWDTKACDVHRPPQEESLDDLVYTLTNPVSAGLVKWGHQWPGFSTYGWHFGETRVFKRPGWYFDPNGALPDEVEVRLEAPAVFDGILSDEQLFKTMMRLVRARERSKQEEMRRQRRRFSGTNKLARQSWARKPTIWEERFRRAPSVAAQDDAAKYAQLTRNKAWEKLYAVARVAFVAGDPSVVFPYGSFWLPRFAGANVAKVPP